MLQKVLGTLEYTDEHTYAHEGVDFTGINFYMYKNLQILSEESYLDGTGWGFYRKWNSNGVLLRFCNIKYGAADGSVKKWYGNGVLQEDSFVDSQIIIRRKRWNQQGEIIEDFRIEDHPEDFDYEQWSKLHLVKLEKKKREKLLSLEIQEIRKEWRKRIKQFEEQIEKYLLKYPSNQSYYEKDFL
jgi:hypothetical protein